MQALSRAPDRAHRSRRSWWRWARRAASLLLGTDASVASLRGRVHRYRGLPLVVTYHPAYLLRTLPDKAKAWEDLLSRAVDHRSLAGAAPRNRSSSRRSRRQACNGASRPYFASRATPGPRARCTEDTCRESSLSVCCPRRAFARRLRLQRPATPGRGHQGGLVGSGQPVPAPRRSRAEPRQHRQGLRGAGSRCAHRGDQRARQRRLDPGHAGARQRSGGLRQVPGGAEPAHERAVAAAGGRRRTIPTSSPIRSSATCSRSSKARRTASPSHASDTSTRCRSTTPRCARSRPTSRPCCSRWR